MVYLGGEPLDEARRMSELRRWLRGEASTGAVFIDARTHRFVFRPRAVDWRLFPMQEVSAPRALQPRRERARRA